MSRRRSMTSTLLSLGIPRIELSWDWLAQYSGVVALINPNGDEHYIYPTAAGLSAGNKTLMNTGTEDINLVPGPVPAGPFLNFKAPGVNILGNHRISGLVTIGGKGIRGAIGFLTGAFPEPRYLYFSDAHAPQPWIVATGRLEQVGLRLGAALRWSLLEARCSPGRHHELHWSRGYLRPPGYKPSGLGFIVGEGMTATMVWTVNGTALAAGSPAEFLQSLRYVLKWDFNF